MDLQFSPEAKQPEEVDLFAEDSDSALIFWLSAAIELASRQDDPWQNAWVRFAAAAETECMRRGLSVYLATRSTADLSRMN
jgi:hypothetical protein